MIRLLPVLLVLTLICSCEEKSNSGSADSAQAQAKKPLSQADSLALLLSQHSTDTTHLIGLPPVFDGDIVFQIDTSDKGKYMKEVMPNKYTHCGMIFFRERDHQYMVMEAHDSVMLTPLQGWVDRGQGQHVAIYRMKDANTMMTKERTQKIRVACRRYKKLPFDYYLNWSDSALYSTEFVWKVYHDGTGYRICEPTTLDSLTLTGADVKKKMAERYGKNIPKKEQVVTLSGIMASPLFEKVYER